MKTLILFATKHGCSKKASNQLNSKLLSQVEICNINDKKPPDIDNFEVIIMGGSIYAGEIQDSIKNYCRINHDKLMKKHLGLYLCCMDKEKAQMQFEKAYDENLRKHAIATGLFGGELLFDKMTHSEQYIIKEVAGIENSISDIDEEAINRFAEKFNLLPQ